MKTYIHLYTFTYFQSFSFLGAYLHNCLINYSLTHLHSTDPRRITHFCLSREVIWVHSESPCVLPFLTHLHQLKQFTLLMLNCSIFFHFPFFLNNYDISFWILYIPSFFFLKKKSLSKLFPSQFCFALKPSKYLKNRFCGIIIVYYIN